MLKRPKILLLSTDAAEAGVLERLLSEYAILRTASNLLEMEAEIESHDYDAVLCSWSFHQGRWQGALHDMQQWRPDLPVIVYSGQAGEQEWMEVAEAGGFDLLAAPYLQSTVLPTLEHAVLSHQARRSQRARHILSTAS